MCVTLLTLASVSLLGAASAAAATLTVTTTTDTLASCSLREAIMAVDNPGTSTPCGPADPASNIIVLGPGTYTLSIPRAGSDDNSTGDLNVTGSTALTITGAGPPSTAVAGLSTLQDRLLSVSSASDVELVGLTLEGGHPTAPPTFTSCSAETATLDGGAIYNDGTLATNVVTLQGNTAGAGTSGTPGASGCPGGDGGALYNAADGTALLNNTMLLHNTAGAGGSGGAGTGSNAGAAGGSGGNGGGAANAGFLRLTNSTLAANTAGAGGAGGMGGSGGGNGGTGGAGGWGGGVFTNGANLGATNATLPGNSAGAGGAGGAGAGGGTGGTGGAGGNGGATAASNAPNSLLNATVAGNGIGAGGSGGSPSGTGGASGSGGGAYVQASSSANHLNLQNTIMAANSTTNCAPSTNITDGGHNLSTDGTCPAVIFANPDLMSLGDYGGYTATMALQPGSPAINAVPVSGAGCPATDQRGVSRPQGSACDIGAFEFAVPKIKITTPKNGAKYKQGSRVRASYTCTEGGITSPISTCTGTVPDGKRIDTSSLGTKSFTVTSTDKAGNTTTKTIHYKVVRK